MSRRCDSLVRHGRLSWITHLPRLSNFHIAGASLSSGSWNKYPLCLSNFLIFCVQFLLTSAISYSLRRKKREKKREKGEKTEEKKQKERKTRIKRRLLSFPFPVPIPQKERKKRRKKKEKEEKKEEKWKKICEFTRLWKTKRPCLSFDRQGLKLCGFNLGKRQTFLPRKKQFGFAET